MNCTGNSPPHNLDRLPLVTWLLPRPYLEPKSTQKRMDVTHAILVSCPVHQIDVRGCCPCERARSTSDTVQGHASMLARRAARSASMQRRSSSQASSARSRSFARRSKSAVAASYCCRTPATSAALAAAAASACAFASFAPCRTSHLLSSCVYSNSATRGTLCPK